MKDYMKNYKCSLWFNSKYIQTVVVARDYTMARAIVAAMFPGATVNGVSEC